MTTAVSDDRIPKAPPCIPPVEAGIPRPLWSVMIPVYNCSNFLSDVLNSVLVQDPGPEIMQIEVVDDASTDADVATLVKQIGNDRVTYFRQHSNVGSLRNFETCLKRAKGFYVHLLHGDDRVNPGFYQKLTALYQQYPEAGAACTAWNYIDEKGNFLHYSNIELPQPGILDDWLYKLASKQRLQYVAVTVKRSVYEHLGGFFGVIYGEDWEMWARIAKHYPVAYQPEFLAEYRDHANHSISKNSFLTGANIQNIKWVINVISSYVPAKDRTRLKRAALRQYMHWAFTYTDAIWFFTRNKKAVFAQFREILNAYLDLKLIWKMSLLCLKIFLHPLKIKLFSMRKVHSGQNDKGKTKP